MKKILFYLFVATIGLTSCSKNDEDSSSDLIIGTWGNYKDIYLPTGYTEYYNPYFVIETYNSNGSFTVESSEVYVGAITINGTWKNIGNGIYKMTVFGISANQNIEFKGNDEMIIYDENGGDGRLANYYERIKK